MEDQPHALFQAWSISSPSAYLASVLASALAVRVASAALKAAEAPAAPASSQRWARAFLNALKGRGLSEPRDDDHWHPFVLGCFELATFPVMMATENWTFVGAWLGFKALAQWGRWKDHRPAFNRFLIGNAAVLCLAYLLAHLFVRPL